MNKKTKVVKEIEEIEYNADSDNDELEMVRTVPIKEKKQKDKKPYILTDARKEQFIKAKEIRLKKIELRKQQKEEDAFEFEQIKKSLENKKNEKIKKKRQNELKKLEKEIDNIDNIEMTIEKEKAITKPKKKIIKYVSESDTETEEEIQYIKREKPIKKEFPPPAVNKIIKPVIRYF